MRLLFDEDLNHRILRGLMRRLPHLDIRTVDDLALAGRDDQQVLEAAAREGRLVVSHDVSSMTAAFQERLDSGRSQFGLLLVPQRLPIGMAVDQLEAIARMTRNEDWVGVMEFLPL
ncbi:MAG: DUF5615 family PIN-like protein [Planctomycetes bacterium]|nr:DUF5615 family PIN-like protein [Planctomycetota bacterium]